jgi:hypothetical protein
LSLCDTGRFPESHPFLEVFVATRGFVFVDRVMLQGTISKIAMTIDIAGLLPHPARIAGRCSSGHLETGIRPAFLFVLVVLKQAVVTRLSIILEK